MRVSVESSSTGRQAGSLVCTVDEVSLAESGATVKAISSFLDIACNMEHDMMAMRP